MSTEYEGTSTKQESHSLESHNDVHLCWGCKEAIEQSAARTQLKPGMAVLDIGCGPGLTSFIIASSYGADVLGVDKAVESIDHANKEYSSKCENVQFQVDDISGDDFKLEDDWFDLVFCHHVICSIEDKCKLLTKLLNCLKIGGTLFIRDLLEDKEFEAKRKDPSHPLYEGWMDEPSFYVDVPTYTQLVRDSGFLLNDGDVKTLHASQYSDEHGDHHHHSHDHHHHHHGDDGDGSGDHDFPQLAVEIVASKPT